MKDQEMARRLAPRRAKLAEKWILSKQSSAKKRALNDTSWNVVSFFSGCGGLDLGFLGGFKYNGIIHQQLPFDIVHACDHDPKAVETYRLNIDERVSVMDLEKYNPRELPAADVLIGGFPCQDFATCGPRLGLDSERGRLYRALIKYAKTHRPKLIVAENVPGLLNIGGGEVLSQIHKEINAAGYRTMQWVLYGPEFGLPQRRTRVFIICVRADLEGFPLEPVPTHKENFRSIQWAIKDLESIETEEVANQSQYFMASRAKRGNGQGDETSKADEPGYTVRANAKSRVQFHYRLERRLTVRECARLQTFPDGFVFPHSATTNVMQIGNAVPPMLAHVVASSVANFLSSLKK